MNFICYNIFIRPQIITIFGLFLIIFKKFYKISIYSLNYFTFYVLLIMEGQPEKVKIL